MPWSRPTRCVLYFSFNFLLVLQAIKKWYEFWMKINSFPIRSDKDHAGNFVYTHFIWLFLFYFLDQILPIVIKCNRQTIKKWHFLWQRISWVPGKINYKIAFIASCIAHLTNKLNSKLFIQFLTNDIKFNLFDSKLCSCWQSCILKIYSESVWRID